jgi:hypothetical protein
MDVATVNRLADAAGDERSRVEASPTH